jgi:hypothetical protein
MSWHDIPWTWKTCKTSNNKKVRRLIAAHFPRWERKADLSETSTGIGEVKHIHIMFCSQSQSKGRPPCRSMTQGLSWPVSEAKTLSRLGGIGLFQGSWATWVSSECVQFCVFHKASGSREREVPQYGVRFNAGFFWVLFITSEPHHTVYLQLTSNQLNDYWIVRSLLFLSQISLSVANSRELSLNCIWYTTSSGKSGTRTPPWSWRCLTVKVGWDGDADKSLGLNPKDKKDPYPLVDFNDA